MSKFYKSAGHLGLGRVRHAQVLAGPLTLPMVNENAFLKKED